MRWDRWVAACAGAIALPALAATAVAGERVEFRQTLSSRAPATPSGMTVHVVFRAAGDPEAKPSPIRAVTIAGPPGLTYDSQAAPQCRASDDELRAQGTAACAPETEVGLGTYTAITGFGAPVDPFVGDDHVLNNDHQLIEVITAPGSTVAPGFDRLTIRGADLIAHPPTTPGGPPDGETATRSIDFTVPVRVSGRRSLITTPSSCPVVGAWRFTGTFTFADGATVVRASDTPCDPVPAPAGCRRDATLPVPRARAGRVARVEVRVDGALDRAYPGRRRWVRVALRSPGPRRFRVVVVAVSPSGRTVASRHALRVRC